MRLDERNNKSPQEVVSSSYNRIKTMALIHEKTYQSENVSSVRIAEFIKSDVDSLMYAFGKKDINMEYDLEESVNVSINQMTPASLILNELITNSLKYAFKDEDENKTISIRFKVKNNKDVELIFKDNGIGLPEGFDMASTSGIGFIVINSLVSQLDGEISTIDCDGTGFKIEFKLLDQIFLLINGKISINSSFVNFSRAVIKPFFVIAISSFRIIAFAEDLSILLSNCFLVFSMLIE